MLRSLLRHCRAIRPVGAGDAPSDLIRARILERERARRRPRDPSRNEFFVATPESVSWLDTATLPMVLTAVAVALFSKLLMMYDDSKAQERLERKIQKAPEGQGTVRMLTREEWEEVQEVRPRTPFESKLARPNARIRTGEPLHLVSILSVKIFLSAYFYSLMGSRPNVFLNRRM
ncbi:cytoplasmic dynein 2 light intermediate chain [Rhynchospora pubera]|uniref:Cytoplasmic dynein 2 light intermediate chain n=1 Tax=Rhynchospora pubera TaxID=906938 RepID=A0AAV8H573_9POAL|nr:cytoplasmic dynein 2 light intermediate chain [Rhynchospora pubera]